MHMITTMVLRMRNLVANLKQGVMMMVIVIGQDDDGHDEDNAGDDDGHYNHASPCGRLEGEPCHWRRR